MATIREAQMALYRFLKKNCSSYQNMRHRIGQKYSLSFPNFISQCVTDGANLYIFDEIPKY